MRGGWLQQRGGYYPRLFGGYFSQVFEYHQTDTPGATLKLLEHTDSLGVRKWRWLAVSEWTFDPFYEITISSGDRPVPAAVVIHKAVVYNGLGVRDVTTGTSKPPLAWTPTAHQGIRQ
jgi:hypothetical protein